MVRHQLPEASAHQKLVLRTGRHQRFEQNKQNHGRICISEGGSISGRNIEEMVWKSVRKLLENLRKVTEKRHGLGSYLEGKGIKSEWLFCVVSEGAGQGLGTWRTRGARGPRSSMVGPCTVLLRKWSGR